MEIKCDLFIAQICVEIELIYANLFFIFLNFSLVRLIKFKKLIYYMARKSMNLIFYVWMLLVKSLFYPTQIIAIYVKIH